jgi:hypothetical protein
MQSGAPTTRPYDHEHVDASGATAQRRGGTVAVTRRSEAVRTRSTRECEIRSMVGPRTRSVTGEYGELLFRSLWISAARFRGQWLYFWLYSARSLAHHGGNTSKTLAKFGGAARI